MTTHSKWSSDEPRFGCLSAGEVQDRTRTVLAFAICGTRSRLAIQRTRDSVFVAPLRIINKDEIWSVRGAVAADFDDNGRILRAGKVIHAIWL